MARTNKTNRRTIISERDTNKMTAIVFVSWHFLLAILVILVVCGCCYDWKSSILLIFLNGSQEKPSPRLFKIVNNESVTKSNIPNIKYHFIVIPMKHIAQQNVMERKNQKINRWKFTLIEYRLRAEMICTIKWNSNDLRNLGFFLLKIKLFWALLEFQFHKRVQ